jgi:YD repeat-containing protein
MARFGHAASLAAMTVALTTSVGAQEQTTYKYDVFGRLIEVNRPSVSTAYTYDDADNRKQLTVTAGNGLPVAQNDGFSSAINVAPGGSVSFNPLSNDTDPDSDNFYLTNVSGWDPNKATSVPFVANCFRTAASCVTYNAKSGQTSGSDTFSYAIADGKGGTANGSIKVTINAASLPPTTSASTTTVTANYGGSTTSYPLTLTISGTANSVAVTSAPPASAGTAQVSGNSILFTPANSYSGQTQLQYTASNNGVASAPATATINVRPVVSNVAGNATTGSPASLALYPRTGFTSLNLVGSGVGTYGNASISGSNVLYTPNSGAGQTETFAYTATTAGGTSTSALITFTIGQGNRAPTANDEIVESYQGVTSTFYPLGNDSDPDGNPLTLQSVSGLEFVYGNNGTPSGLGTLTKTGNTVSYTAPLVCNCAARSKYHVIRFSYVVADSFGLTSTAKHAINVYSNQPPVANTHTTDPVPAGVTTLVDPRVNDTDGDNDNLTIKSIDNFYFAYGTINGVSYSNGQTPPISIGSVTRNDTSISYTAPHLSAGSYMAVVVWYTVSDGRGGTSQSYEVLNVYGPG